MHSALPLMSIMYLPCATSPGPKQQSMALVASADSTVHACRFNVTGLVAVYKGLLQVPSPAAVTFFLQSSDGSELYLDLRNQCKQCILAVANLLQPPSMCNTMWLLLPSGALHWESLDCSHRSTCIQHTAGHTMPSCYRSWQHCALTAQI